MYACILKVKIVPFKNSETIILMRKCVGNTVVSGTEALSLLGKRCMTIMYIKVWESIKYNYKLQTKKQSGKHKISLDILKQNAHKIDISEQVISVRLASTQV